MFKVICVSLEMFVNLQFIKNQHSFVAKDHHGDDEMPVKEV